AIAPLFIHRDEPLRRRAKDHRILAAPAVRISMIVILAEEQHATVTHEINDFRIRFKDAETGKMLYFSRKSARVIDWTINLQAVLLADHKVVVTMTGSCVHQ